MDYELHHGDCLEVLPTLAANSVDAIICDPPYGTTACAWDSVIPFEPMWECIKHVIKPRGAVVLFGSEPFSSLLRTSNLDWYKYDWVWDKSNPTGHLDCNKKPMKKHELISVFAISGPNYNPQIADRPKGNVRPDSGGNGTSVYGTFRKAGGMRTIPITKTCPQTILRYNSVNALHRLHSTQKPVELMSYLIRTYTNPDETVLDFTMGSGSTGVAALECGRKFIGIEMDNHYFNVASERIEKTWRRLQGLSRKATDTHDDLPLFSSARLSRDWPVVAWNSSCTPPPSPMAGCRRETGEHDNFFAAQI